MLEAVERRPPVFLSGTRVNLLMEYREEELREIAQRLRVDVSDYSLLRQALTHRSYLGEHPESSSNERLEFLGDSVLGLVVAEHLYQQFPECAEGELAKAKAVAVSAPVLAQSARAMGLSEMILMSSGEETGGGRQRDSILADAFEALIAVIYFDCGLEAAREFVLAALKDILQDIRSGQHLRDYKTQLQEQTQGLMKKAPKYVVVDEHGADHDKTFVVEATVNGRVLGRGVGKNKKQAQQAAALVALETLEMDGVSEEGEGC